MALIVEALDGRFLDGSVHSLHLPIRPRVLGLGQPVVDVVLRAAELEGVGAEELSAHYGFFDLGDGRGTSPWYRELDAVVGENGMDLVGYGRDEMGRKSGGHGGCLLMELDKGELRRAVDGDEEMELALFCPDFGDVDMEEADRVGLELPFGGLIALGISQLADAVSLQAAVQRGSRQMRDRRLQSVETIVERQ